MFFQLLNSVGQARYGKVSIIDDGAVAQIIQMRQSSSFGDPIPRLIFNRPTYFIFRFVKNWTSHFTFSFLFSQGGSHYQFSVPNHGLLYLVNIPFLLIGFFSLVKKASKDKSSLFLLSWFFLSPIPSSLTREAPHVLRSITFLPIPMIISSVGLLTFVNWLERFFGEKVKVGNDLYLLVRKFVYIVYLLLLVIFVNGYLSKYFGEYKKNYSWSWQYGYKQVIEYSRKNYDKYDKIIVTKKYGEPHEFILFYWPWEPSNFLNDSNLTRFYQSNWYWVDSFDKFYFINDWDVPKEEWQSFDLESGKEVGCDSSKCLLITSPKNYPKTWKFLEKIDFLDGETAFEIYEN
jgi:hypothetical protein